MAQKYIIIIDIHGLLDITDDASYPCGLTDSYKVGQT